LVDLPPDMADGIRSHSFFYRKRIPPPFHNAAHSSLPLFNLSACLS
jgi:hypothetical protein